MKKPTSKNKIQFENEEKCITNHFINNCPGMSDIFSMQREMDEILKKRSDVQPCDNDAIVKQYYDDAEDKFEAYVLHTILNGRLSGTVDDCIKSILNEEYNNIMLFNCSWQPAFVYELFTKQLFDILKKELSNVNELPNIIMSQFKQGDDVGFKKSMVTFGYLQVVKKYFDRKD